MDFSDLAELVDAFLVDSDPSMLLACTLESIAIGLFGEIIPTERR
jgi:hypothetical protein